MPNFKWNNYLSVNDPVLDSDHRHIIGLLDELHGAMEQGKSQDILERVLADLFTYTREHFKREEELMQRIHYADFSAHKAEHQKLMLTVVDLQKRLREGEACLNLTVITFLFDWVFNHIMSVDKKLAAVAFGTEKLNNADHVIH